MRIWIREIKGRKIVKQHQKRAQQGRKSHANAEDQRNTQEREPPFIDKIHHWEHPGAYEPLIKLWESFCPFDISLSSPIRIQHLGDPGVQEQPPQRNTEREQRKFLREGHVTLLYHFRALALKL